MKTKILCCIAVLSTAVVQAQNVGIGTTTPTDQLHTTGSVRFEKYKGSGLRPLQVDDSGRVVAAIPGGISSNNTSMNIPDDGCTGVNGITSNIVISGMPTSIIPSNIAVMVDIAHTFDEDIKLSLTAPNGYTITLAANNGNNGQNFSSTIFSDDGAINIATGTAPFRGIFKPNGTNAANCDPSVAFVSTFGALGANINPNGTWTLKVFDAAPSDVGVLKSWNISFNGSASLSLIANNGFLPKFNQNGGFDASNIVQDAATGKIGISVLAGFNPAADLDVNGTTRIRSDAEFNGIVKLTGSLKLETATPAAGKILTCTGTDGYATWQTPASLSNTSGFLCGADMYNTTTFASGTTYTLPYIFGTSTNVTNSFDDGSNYNNTNNTYTAPVAGFYRFDFKLNFITALAAQNGDMIIYFNKNGTDLSTWKEHVKTGEASPNQMDGSISIKLQVGDVIKLKFMQNLGVTVNRIGLEETRFSGYKIY